MDTFTKIGIIETVVEKTELTRREATEAIEVAIEIMKEQLEKGAPVLISGFGKWKARAKVARRGRNPQTGDEITITQRRVITFSLSNILRSKLGA
jgi:integration host factor subunit alpha